ncbi:MAG: lipid-A-disaccharide synthase, partial [Rhodocyclaceae bacterium]|nr:lipid-A-disaccharide synthase [Rhodocyclaceae bacterium]
SGVRRDLCRQILRELPDAFIGVDAPDFNLGLEARLKAAGLPTIHFVSPSIWAWRGGRIKRIARSVSHMLCLFPFEPELYEARGIPVTYVGHPLADVLPLEPDRAGMREKLGLPDGQLIFAMLPGSRQSEARNLGPLFIDTIQVLAQRHPDAQFLVPLATRETLEIFQQVLDAAGGRDLPVRLMRGHAWDAMTAADAVLVASGTATLEAALLKRPMVITYRIGQWQYRLMKRMAYLPWVGLPNILCNDTVVPEILQDEATPQALAEALDGWVADKAACQRLEGLFTEMHLHLRQDTARRAAEAILPYLGRR